MVLGRDNEHNLGRKRRIAVFQSVQNGLRVPAEWIIFEYQQTACVARAGGRAESARLAVIGGGFPAAMF
jgi:hypothetical protein